MMKSLQQVVLLLAASLLVVQLTVLVRGETSDDPDFTDMQDLIHGQTGAVVAKLYYRLDALDEASLPSGATTDESDGTNAITFKMVYDGTAWLGLGPSPSSEMIDTIATIGVINEADGSSTVQTYGPITAENADGVTTNVIGSDGLVDATMTQENSQTVLMYTQPLNDGGSITYDLSGDNPMAFAIGGDNSFPSYHGGGRGPFTLSLANVARPDDGSGSATDTSTTTDATATTNSTDTSTNSTTVPPGVGDCNSLATSLKRFDSTSNLFVSLAGGIMIVALLV